MEPFDADVVRRAYDSVAADYDAAFGDDLVHLPVDRAALARASSHLDPGDSLLDLGCGTGSVAQYLTARGSHVVGIDLSDQMLHMAASRAGDAPLVCGDMRTLPFRSEAFAAAVAFYSIQHLRRSELEATIAECRRVLTTSGLLVIAAHLGEGEVVVDNFLGHHIDGVGGTFYRKGELRDALRTGGFAIEHVRERDPLPHEYPSKRIYLAARRETGFSG